MKNTSNIKYTGFIVDFALLVLTFFPALIVPLTFIFTRFLHLSANEWLLLKFCFISLAVMLPVYIMYKIYRFGSLNPVKKIDDLFYFQDNLYVCFTFEDKEDLIEDPAIILPIINEEITNMKMTSISNWDKEVGLFKITSGLKMRCRFYKRPVFFLPFFDLIE